MNRAHRFAVAIPIAATVTVLAIAVRNPASAQVQGSVPSYIKLQSASPGTPQSGNMNVSGISVLGRVAVGTSPHTAMLDFASQLGEKICFYQGNGNGNYGISIMPFTMQLHTTDASGDIVLGYGNSGLMNETMRVKGNGNVGIGTTTPGAKLDVNGSVFTRGLTVATGVNAPGVNVTTTGGTTKAELHYSNEAGEAGGALHLYGANGNRRFYAEGLDSGGRGNVGLDNANGSAKVQAYISYVGYGIVAADQKNFKMPDPNNEQRDIVYCCPEGPEAAMYDRGTAHLVNGRCHVTLPEHFSSLASAEGMTLSLTPGSGESKGLAYENRSPEGFDVVELGNGKGTYEFDWEIKAVRRGHEDYRVYRPWDEDMPSGRNKKAEWASRQKNIAFYKERFAVAPVEARKQSEKP